MFRPDTPVDHKFQLEAVRAALSTRTLPILAQESSGLAMYGSATLFRAAGRLFLITADHVVEALVKSRRRASNSNLFVPADRFSPARVDLSGRICWRANDPYDIAVVDLTDSVHDLSAWVFAEPRDVAPRGSSFYYCAMGGYPVALAKGGVPAAYAFFLCEVADDERFQDQRALLPDVEIGLHYSRTAVDGSGTESATPELHGISGCGIWGLVPHENPSESIWTAASQLRLVGVEKSFVHSRFVRGTSFNNVCRLIASASPEAAQEICAAALPMEAGPHWISPLPHHSGPLD